MDWRNRIVEVTEREPRTLLPHPENWRRHPKRQRTALAGILEDVGWLDGVIVSRETNRIIDGHLRLELALETETATIPVTIVDLSEEEERLLLIGLDPTAEMARHDDEVLRPLLERCSTETPAVRRYLDQLGRKAGLNRDRPEPAPPESSDPVLISLVEKWGTAPGQVWLLGPHRIACGPPTDPATVQQALGEHKPLLMVTDPPYGDQGREDFPRAFRLFPGRVAYVWHPSRSTALPSRDLEAAGFALRSQLIWERPPRDGDHLNRYATAHAACWYGVRPGGTSAWNGDRAQSTIWEIPDPRQSLPVECHARAIRNHGEPEDAVYDPYLTLGTTLVAAEQEQRVCVGVNDNPGYLAACLERYEAATGITPTRAEA